MKKKLLMYLIIIVIFITSIYIYFSCFSRFTIKSSGNHNIKPEIIEIVGQEYTKIAKDYIDYVVEWYNSTDVRKPVATDMNYKKMFKNDDLYVNFYYNAKKTEKEKSVVELNDSIIKIHDKILEIHSKRSETLDANNIKIEREAWKELKIIIEKAIDVFCIDK